MTYTLHKSGQTFSSPANLGAERALLGAFLLQPGLLSDARAAGLRANDFALDSHRRIFARMLDLTQSDRPLDLITLADELNRHRELTAIGGTAYLADLTSGAIPHQKHVLYHVAIVVTKAKLRSIQRIGERIQQEAAEPTADPKQLAADFATELNQIFGQANE